MLKIQGIAVRMIAELRGSLVAIETADRDLGRQLRRAAASVVHNLAEGSGSAGGTWRERYRSAHGSLREVEAALEVAVAFGYVGEVPAAVRDGIAIVGSSLRKLT